MTKKMDALWHVRGGSGSSEDNSNSINLKYQLVYEPREDSGLFGWNNKNKDVEEEETRFRDEGNFNLNGKEEIS